VVWLLRARLQAGDRPPTPSQPRLNASDLNLIARIVSPSQYEKKADDNESGERRHDDYPATTDRIHLVVLNADNLQLASSGAVAEGCIQPLTHW
jgi:hypothetical protein